MAVRLDLPPRMTRALRWWRNLSVVLMGFAVAMMLNLILSVQYKLFEPTHVWDLWFQALLQSFVALVGIRAINLKLDANVPWNKNLRQRFWLQSSLNLGYVLLSMLVMQVLFAAFRYLTGIRQFISLSDEVAMTFIFVLLSFVVVLIDWGLFLLSSWRSSEAMTERYRKERIEFQFEMLRNQVNPHFLFNNLNTIASLVHEQPDVAAEFVRQLSKVYRYLLEYQSREVISLQEEQEFLTAYIYLIKMRFGQNVNFDISLAPALLNHQVVPVCLQMLVENALKHNIASKSKPLTISIKTDDTTGALIVSNNLQPKTKTEFSSRIGLVNIKSRYQFLTSQEVIIEQDTASFTVKLPLLHPHESTHSRR